MKFEVTSLEQGMKLLPFLRKHCGDISSVKGLKRAIDTKGCRINGRLETISTRLLKKGDRIELELAEKIEKPLLLFEDEEICIYNKPPHLASEDVGGKLVHRLDKETSGALIVAKTEAARKKMVDLFLKRAVKKQYLAIVDGIVLKKEGKIVSTLVEKRTPSGQIYSHSARGGKEAITHWRCLGTGEKASLILCEPITGRTHQIRVHMKEMGHPILGDMHYAKKLVSKLPARRHLLHAWKIAFEEIEAVAPLPEDFLEALRMTHLIEFLDKEEKNRRRNK